MKVDIKHVLGCAVCIMIGYIAGREHIKYDMRTAFQSTVAEIQKGFAPFGIPSSRHKTPKTKEAEQPIAITLVGKGFEPKDFEISKYSEEITIAVRFDNRTGKNIRAFDGTILFTDLLDNEVLRSRVEINQLINSDTSLDWNGSIDFSEYRDSHKRLRGEPQENLKLLFYAGKILFDDGTTNSYE